MGTSRNSIPVAGLLPLLTFFYLKQGPSRDTKEQPEHGQMCRNGILATGTLMKCLRNDPVPCILPPARVMHLKTVIRTIL